MRRRSALITGASRGLGLTLADFLAGQGYELTITGRNEQALQQARSSLARYTRVTAVAGDVRDAAHHRALRSTIGEKLDLLVNNASELGVTPLPPLAAYDLEVFREVYETNVIAPLALIQTLLPALQKSGGLVVNISSDAAQAGYPGWGAYGSSKAALELIGRTLAAELEGVAVVSVDPGDMRTRLHQQAFPGEDISDRPLPAVTLPFWAWLLGQQAHAVSGLRFEAQADTWQVEEAAVGRSK